MSNRLTTPRLPNRKGLIVALVGIALLVVVGAVVTVRLTSKEKPAPEARNAPSPAPESPAEAPAPAEAIALPEPLPAPQPDPDLNPGPDAKPETAPPAPTSDLSTPYKATQGPHKIVERPSISFRDDARSRTIPLRVSAPNGDGPYPVILFSHGMMGSKDGYLPLARHWASHGYVVIQPTHLDSLQVNPRATVEERQSEWRSRAEDMLFLVRNLKAVAAAGEFGPLVLDAEKIAVAGHSFGAHTSTLLAGANARTGVNRRELFSDTVIDCAVWLSPQGLNFLLDSTAYAAVTMPVLTITGSLDTSPIQASLKATDRRQSHEHSAAGNKWMVWVEGLSHNMGGISEGAAGRLIRRPNASSTNETHVTLVKSATTAFFDTYLRDDASAKAWLAGPGLAAMSASAATVEQR